MNIHIEHQTAGIINIAEGDLSVYGGQQGAVTSDEHARRAARELRDALPAVALDRPAARKARVQVAEIDEAVRALQPDKSRVARLLEQFTRLLRAAGSLTMAGAAVIGPLHTLAGWLGALGAPVLSMLLA